MLLRLAMMAAIGLVVATRLSVADSYEHDVLQGAHDTFTEAGLAVLPSSQLWAKNYGSVRVRPAGCNGEVAAVPFHIMIDAAAMRRVTEVETGATRIVYFGKEWDSQVKPALFVSLLNHSARHALGVSKIYPSNHALLLSGPADCLAALPGNLAEAWHRKPPT